MYDLMLAEVHQACREPREVGDGVEEDLGGLVHAWPRRNTSRSRYLPATSWMRSTLSAEIEFLEQAEPLALGVGRR